MNILISSSLLMTMSIFTMQAVAVTATDKMSESKPDSGGSKLAETAKAETVFPEWPERKLYPRAAQIPPPPPGPYMSTALSGVSVGFPSAGNTPPRPVYAPVAPGANWQPMSPRGFQQNGRYPYPAERYPVDMAPGRFDGRGIMPMLQPMQQRPAQGQY